MKKLLLMTITLASPVFGNLIQFNFSDNSDNEDGFQLCEVKQTDDGTEVVQVLETVEKNIESFSVSLEKVANKSVAVRAYNKWGHSGFTNVLEIGNIPSTPSNLITIQIDVQIH